MVNTMPPLLYAWEGDPVPLVQKAGWVQKILHSLGFEPQIVQPVVNCCTKYAILATNICSIVVCNYINCK